MTQRDSTNDIEDKVSYGDTTGDGSEYTTNTDDPTSADDKLGFTNGDVHENVSKKPLYGNDLRDLAGKIGFGG